MTLQETDAKAQEDPDSRLNLNGVSDVDVA